MPVITSHSILDDIVDYTRGRLKAVQQREPLSALREKAAQLPPPVGFATELTGDRIKIIAEVKKASPSAGLLRPGMRPVALAKSYATGGAAAISILTEPKFFRGNLTYLERIRTAFDQKGFAARIGGSRPPLLRKDFLFDPYQVYQARAYGADALLLIVAILDDKTLSELLDLTRSLKMEALVEVHDEQEAKRAIDAGAKVIGINNRDLRTFRTDIATTFNLRALIPQDFVVVSESGIKNHQDILQLREAGVDAVLIGESLVTAPDAQAKLRELLG